MSDEPRKPRRPAPQRPPGELAELLAAMSEEAGEATPQARVRRPPGRSGGAPPRRQVTSRPPAPVSPPPAVPPAAPSPPEQTPPPTSETSPPAPETSPPAPETSRPEPEPAPPAPAVPESDVVAGMPVSDATWQPEGFAEDPDADLALASQAPRAQSRTSGRVGRPDSRGRKPPRTGRAARSGRAPAGRGLEPPRVRSRGQQRLRLALVGGGLLIVVIILLAVLGSSGGTHHAATSPPTTPLPTQHSSTVPPPRTTATTTHRPAPPPAAAASLKGASHDVLLIPRLLPGRSGAPALAVAHSSLVVIDPGNGPGSHPDPALRAQIAAVRHAGGRPLGYVATGRGRRPARAVRLELARYRHWYGVHDVYLADAATGAGELGYYRRLAHGARARGARLVVLEPGAVPAHGYFGIANVIVTFDGSYRSYLRVSSPPSLAHIAPDRQANLVTGAATARDARRALRLARRRGVGLAFVTSGSGPQALDAMPSYLGHERSWLAGSGHSH